MTTHGSICLVFVPNGRRSEEDMRQDAQSICDRWPLARENVQSVRTTSWLTVMSVHLHGNFLAIVVREICIYMRDDFRGYKRVPDGEVERLLHEGAEAARQSV